MAARIVNLRLYVAGDATNSAGARANLEAIMRSHGFGRFRLEIVDVLREPERAVEDGVLVTPTLIRIAPRPGVRIIGDLSDAPAVGRALGLRAM